MNALTNWDNWNPYTFANAKAIIALTFCAIMGVVMLASAVTTRKNTKKLLWYLLLLFWIFTILSATFLGRRESGEGKLNLTLFWCFKRAWTEHSGRHWYYIIGNILLFLPFGFLLPMADPKTGAGWWCVLLISFCFSAAIEIGQYMTRLGLCELDDIVHNTYGGYLGYQTWVLLCGRGKGIGIGKRMCAVAWLAGTAGVLALLLAINRPL